MRRVSTIDQSPSGQLEDRHPPDRVYHLPFGARGSAESGRQISSLTPAGDFAAILASVSNTTFHPVFFQPLARLLISCVQAFRFPNAVPIVQASGAVGAFARFHISHAHSADADETVSRRIEAVVIAAIMVAPFQKPRDVRAAR
jgi:hypothetical protein